ncbi:MAG TPA: thymidine phosphorylase [Gemmatimonadales bacterium]|nr:thymidine phosphorylase [Gemmatimonadales bacterium]
MWAGPLIERKRDGAALTPEEWRELISAYTAGRVPDYQMAALLMAVYLNGLEPEETAALTGAMLDSGERLRFDHLKIRCVDKHSTGGVGDKVSLILAPLVASCGVAVPMISGRALGHTGGTLDKLEAIPGFRTALSPSEVQRQVESLGCAMIGQSADIAPADRKLYALRDATSTVESIPLIAASIMSKKLAEGIAGLVLDIKRGSGAFLPDLDDELELARTMIQLGEDHGCRTVALLTAMDRPLGSACGVALETEEAIAGLKGEAPADLMEVTYALGVEMLLLGGVATAASDARAMLVEAIRSGRAADRFRTVIAAQGGNPAVLDDPGLLPQARDVATYAAPRAGHVASVEPRVIGKAIVEMGGGRRTMDDAINPAVGFVIAIRPGDVVEAGQPLGSIYAGDAEGIRVGVAALNRAVRIVAEPPPPPLPLISHRVTRSGVETLG